MEKKPVLPCSECGTIVRAVTKTDMDTARRGRAYCSEECKVQYLRRLSSETMARTNRRDASTRMRERNPMREESSRQKMASTLRAIGHRPTPGGNGNGPTVPQLTMANALGEGWIMEYPVKTGLRWPPCYKVDIGHPGMKIAVELDGGSHATLSRKAEDAVRDERLRGVGWTVLRFKNTEAMERLSECLSTISASPAYTPTSPQGS